MTDWNSPEKKKEESTMDFKPFEPGIYEFVIIESEDRKSKSGNDMTRVNLKFADGARTTRVYDYIVFRNQMFNLCRCVGLCESEDDDLPTEKLLGSAGKAELYIDNYNGKDNNKVREYVMPEDDDEPVAQPQEDEEISDDDIPF